MQEFGNPKGIKKGVTPPLYYEICEAVKSMLDAKEEIPLPLLAKLIKWKLLDIKAVDKKKRDMEKKVRIYASKSKSLHRRKFYNIFQELGKSIITWNPLTAFYS